ncbi:YicC/YloC family endoribonuclease [Ureibacillus sp. BA0131]|uniref:YicC/YloC family endoribonuclease n=1 Tax=Ureibacillus aquaedulcis TaxID=3058421 RepID=A0ABT8GRZ0_9BACL|nr:YicC/YloC family endoribonuclease [Ureibacillus sp. BA0131]MDN4494187.1 YicC/YloC family endoribonuclease [Ureibacillus sp. BA0131]
MVRSMTGFGRGVTATNNYQLTVEVRSVNHRFLEIYTKFPKEWFEAELATKKQLSQYVKRGKVDVAINLKAIGNETLSVQINWPLIEAYKNAKEQLQGVIPLDEKWSMQEILSLENVISYEKQELSPEELMETISLAVKDAAEKLVEMRIQEGEQLKYSLLSYNDQLKELIQLIRGLSGEAVNKFRDRLVERLKEVGNLEVLEDRMLAEVAIFAEKIDISEELDRLDSHFKQLESTMEESDSIGRKLDFLMQEMHREINTIGSKNQNSIISVAVVQSKTILEKMREQVQNIE